MRTIVTFALLFVALTHLTEAATFKFSVEGKYETTNPAFDPGPFLAPDFTLTFFMDDVPGPIVSGERLHYSASHITYENNGTVISKDFGSVMLVPNPATTWPPGGGVSVVFAGNAAGLYNPFDELYLTLTGPQLFSGSMTAPVMQPGMYHLSSSTVWPTYSTSMYCFDAQCHEGPHLEGTATLVIEEIPEPSSALLITVPLGLMFVNLYRCRQGLRFLLPSGNRLR